MIFDFSARGRKIVKYFGESSYTRYEKDALLNESTLLADGGAVFLSMLMTPDSCTVAVQM